MRMPGRIYRAVCGQEIQREREGGRVRESEREREREREREGGRSWLRGVAAG